MTFLCCIVRVIAIGVSSLFFVLFLTQSCLVDSSTSLFGQVHFQFEGCLFCLSVLSFIIEIPVLNANSVDPDQMPHFAASDLGLHCLQMCLLWYIRYKYVKNSHCAQISLPLILIYTNGSDISVQILRAYMVSGMISTNEMKILYPHNHHSCKYIFTDNYKNIYI